MLFLLLRFSEKCLTSATFCPEGLCVADTEKKIEQAVIIKHKAIYAVLKVL